MTNVDQFESVFRSAAKEIFVYDPVEIGKVLVVTDLDDYRASLFADRVRAFLRVIDGSDDDAAVEWSVVRGDEYAAVPELLARVEGERPDLICTYRHLQSDGWKWPFTLGDHLEVLTQAIDTPIVVIPHPAAEGGAEDRMTDTSTVMAITDHLTGDARLINMAVRMTDHGGTLILAHVEDEQFITRAIEAISKIPELDTDVARQKLQPQLLKEPRDYIRSCRAALEPHAPGITVEEIVTVGHFLREYTRLVAERRIDLIVFNTKDGDQLAMHGLAYALAVELRDIPLLML